MLTIALRTTIYPIDFAMYSTCPRAEIEPVDIPVNLPIHYDSLAVREGFEKILKKKKQIS